MLRVAVIPGDGIGVEVTREACRVLERVAALHGKSLRLVSFDFGAERYLRDGVTLPQDALARFQSEFDAILLGAVGDPRVKDNRHALDILFGLRFGLDLYCNVRPVKLLDRRLTPLRDRTERDIQFTIFRENTEDLYVGIGGTFKKGTDDEVAIEESISTRKGVYRIIDAAFAYAAARGLEKVTMSDKSNALRHAGDLWGRTFDDVAQKYPDIAREHLYIDALALELVRDPSRFQVIVTANMFGDILTDLAAALQGGLGVAPSGNIHPGRLSMFEPVHGSAPPLAGGNVANPMGAILSAAMMLEHAGWAAEAAAVESAVRAAVEAGACTPDLGGALGTREVGEAVLGHLM